MIIRSPSGTALQDLRTYTTSNKTNAWYPALVPILTFTTGVRNGTHKSNNDRIPSLLSTEIPLFKYFNVFLLALLLLGSSGALAKVMKIEAYSPGVLLSKNNANHSTNMTLNRGNYSISSLYKRRGREYKPQYNGRHKLSQDIINFMCDKISDPCLRTAFLRLRVYHEICTQLPLIYLLPYIAHTIDDFVLTYLPQPHCNGYVSGLQFLSSDGVYSKFLLTKKMCHISLFALDEKIRSSIDVDRLNFDDLLARSFCSYSDRPSNRTGDFDCAKCQNAYASWHCSKMFPIFYPVDHLLISRLSNFGHPCIHEITPSKFSQNLVSSTNSSYLKEQTEKSFERNPHELLKIPACESWCTEVETLCPYLHPGNSSSLGGEPTFVCDTSHNEYSFVCENPSKNLCELDCCYNSADLSSDSIDSILFRKPEGIGNLISREFCSHLESRCFHNLRNFHLVRHNISGGATFFSFHPKAINSIVPNLAHSDASKTIYSQLYIILLFCSIFYQYFRKSD